jgi:prepilin peptidase CpaA
VITSALFFGWALAIVLFDCFLRRVPNLLVLAGLLFACTLAVLGRSPFETTLVAASLGVVVGLFALLPFFMLDLMGGADVKVFAVLGAWCGVHALPRLWVAAGLAAGVHAVFLLTHKSHGMAHAKTGEIQGDVVPAAATPRVQLPGGSISIGRHRAPPYAAFLAVAAMGLLAIQTLKVTL